MDVEGLYISLYIYIWFPQNLNCANPVPTFPIIRALKKHHYYYTKPWFFLGTCFGKFTKSKKFRLHVTALDFLAPYSQHKTWLKVLLRSLLGQFVDFGSPKGHRVYIIQNTTVWGKGVALMWWNKNLNKDMGILEGKNWMIV